MSRPLSNNLKFKRALQTQRNDIRTGYIDKINKIDKPALIKTEPIKIPEFKAPEIPKFDPIPVPKIEKVEKPVEQTNTIDDFEREYQAFIEKLKKEKEKKELKEELKSYCRDYINELLGIKTLENNTETENETIDYPEEEIPEKETTEEDSEQNEEFTQEEPKTLEEEYQDFINNLKQTRKENYNE